LVQLLDATTDAPAWPHTCDIWKSGDKRESATEMPEVVVENSSASLNLPPLEIPNFSEIANKMLSAAAKALVDEEQLLTKYDTIVGDGDCGITMKRGGTEVLKRLENGDLKTDHPVSMFASIADAVSASMGGTAGVLIELMFRKMSASLSREEKIGASQMKEVMKVGTEAIILYGGANVGSRTMLDALVPASDEMADSRDAAAAASKAKEGADSTAKMASASAGRSNYLSAETLEGTPDPGAVAVSIVLQEIAKIV
jgi:dihydroxyacetone kinase